MPGIPAVVKEPHSILRKVARTVPVRDITGPKIQGLISRLKKTLAVTPDGVGLAAPQVGESLQIFIVSSEAEEIDSVEKLLADKKLAELKERQEAKEKKKWKYHVFINPVVKNVSKRKTERSEGCLSVPGKFGAVKRQEKITVEAYDEYGRKFTRGSTRFFARVIQHELDHLRGTLFIDKAEKIFESDTAVGKRKEI